MIPALTVWQPWASLIVAGAKPYEWRRHRAPKTIIGKRMAIHAGARGSSRLEIAALCLMLCRGNTSSLIAEVALPLLERWHTSPGMLPLSSILCTAVVGEPITAAAYAEQYGIAPYDSERIDHSLWGWPLTDIEVLRPYVPHRGAQGIWYWIGP